MKRRYSRPMLGMAGTMAWLIAVGLPARADTAAPTSKTTDPPAATVPEAPTTPASGSPAVTGTEAPHVSTDPARVSLELKELAPEQAARRLGAVLGGEVRLEGPTNRRVTLTLEEVTVREALDRAARAMDATWKCTYLFTKATGASIPPSPRTGLKVSLSLSDTSCQTAAIIATKAAGGQVEGANELTGRVSLVGKEIPVEEAMSQIAQASGATWRPVYTFKLEAPTVNPLPEEKKPTDPAKPFQRQTSPNLPVYERSRGRFIDKNGRQRFHSMPKERRTKYNQLSRYGAKPRPPQIVDVDRMERLSRLGAFAGIFSSNDAKKREQQIERFCAALKAQAERLAIYRPEQRRLASQLTVNQLRGILNDVQALDEQQKKEVAPILDAIDKQLKDLTGETQPKAPANPSSAKAP